MGIFNWLFIFVIAALNDYVIVASIIVIAIRNSIHCAALLSVNGNATELQLFSQPPVLNYNCFYKLQPPFRIQSINYFVILTVWKRSVNVDLLSYSALYNKDFIDEFTEILSVTVPTCDNFLILGDFNIHVCCPSKPLAS